jgi:N-acetylmuramoyl-L-alanine amidase
MVKRPFVLITFIAAAIVLASVASAQSLSVRMLYADALAKETAVRAALSARNTPLSVLKAVRTVVADFEALVRRHPTSAYCDDALWHAARLSSDAFTRLGEERERVAAQRLLRTLALQYPASKFAKQATSIIAAADAPGKMAPVRPATAAPKAGSVVKAASLANAARAPLVAIKDIRRALLPDTVRIIIELDGEVPFYDERLDNPARVFVDLGGIRATPEFLDRTIRFDGDADVVRRIRVGRHPNNTTRVVLDVSGVSSYSVYPLYNPYRLVVDCIRDAPSRVDALGSTAGSLKQPINIPQPPIAAATAAVPAAPLRPLHARVIVLGKPTALPRLVAEATGFHRAPGSETAAGVAAKPIAAAAETPMVPRAPITAAVAAPGPPPLPPPLPSRPAATNLAGGFSIARQLGLSVSRIVIDPGHGGHDPGALGKGITEAELVLDVALRLERLLEKLADVEVILTRRTDAFVPLEERTAIANREGADLFLSIHANASSNLRARGIETYFLNFATTRNAAAVAARENAASGQAMAALRDLVQAIALNNKADESRDLATYVQRAMVERLRRANKSVRDLGVKQAPFVVLIGAAMPSALAEIAFVTNAQEARLLKSSAYRQRIAEALANAVRNYQGSLKGPAPKMTQ